MDEKYRKKGRLRRVAIFLAVIFLGLVALRIPDLREMSRETDRKMNALKETLSSYGNAIMRSDYAAAYDIMGSEFRSKETFPEFESKGKKMRSNFGPLQSVKWTLSSLHGFAKSSAVPMQWSADVQIEQVFQNRSITVQYHFRWENEGWKVQWTFQPDTER